LNGGGWPTPAGCVVIGMRRVNGLWYRLEYRSFHSKDKSARDGRE
jgi:hypothetical protein